MPRRNSPSRTQTHSSQAHRTPPAKKSLGQHFLVDESVADRIIEAANLSPADTVLEIGPGPGILTRRLIEKAGRVVAVEIDDSYVSLLKQELSSAPNLTIVHGDILELDPIALVYGKGVPDRIKVVANLPYYITSPILRHLLETDPPLDSAVLMVQQEVAERICAQPGDLSILAVSVQFYSTPTLCFTVPATAFRPRPKVESAVIHLAVRDGSIVEGVYADDFFMVVKAGFGQKRKQLVNSLSSGMEMSRTMTAEILESAGIDPMRRAETLTLEEWGKITRSMG